jgi:hypothetical protein
MDPQLRVVKFEGIRKPEFKLLSRGNGGTSQVRASL